MSELRNGLIVAVVSVALTTALTVPVTRYLDGVRGNHASSENKVSDLKEFRDLARSLNSEIRRPDYEAFDRDIPKLQAETKSGKYRELLPGADPDGRTLVSITDAASEEADNYLTCIKESRNESARRECRFTAYGYLMPTFSALSDEIDDITDRHGGRN
jgi:DNA-binding cell septation regulator SpoVG